nr:hypothetical protein [Paenalcaligenes hominis]
MQGPTATKMLEELNSLGLVGLGYGMAGMRQILVRQDLQSADQLKGKKIRTIPIEPELDFWRKVGQRLLRCRYRRYMMRLRMAKLTACKSTLKGRGM